MPWVRALCRAVGVGHCRSQGRRGACRCGLMRGATEYSPSQSCLEGAVVVA